MLINVWLVADFFPIEKYMSSSVGMMIFHDEGKNEECSKKTPTSYDLSLQNDPKNKCDSLIISDPMSQRDPTSNPLSFPGGEQSHKAKTWGERDKHRCWGKLGRKFWLNLFTMICFNQDRTKLGNFFRLGPCQQHDLFGKKVQLHKVAR